MLLEALAEASDNYIELASEKRNNLLIINWKPLVSAMLDSTSSPIERASVFHASLARALLVQAKAFRDVHKVNTVLQNLALLWVARGPVEVDEKWLSPCGHLIEAGRTFDVRLVEHKSVRQGR